MATATLSATLRTDTGKGVARKLRQAGSVPAVIYGHGREPQSLTLNERELERLVERTAYLSTVIELNVDGTVARSLIREVQRHPFKKQILHVDFQEVVAGETITLKCPLVYHGNPEGVRSGGGLFDQILHEVMIEVLPSAIPDHIDVDVTSLGVGKSLHVADLVLPAGVTVLDAPEATVCVVHPPKGATVDTEAGDSAEPEVMRRGKAETEE